jgi:uroporphyrinogen decarboxylase
MNMQAKAPYKPDFNRLATTLRGGKADRVPLMELGIHPDHMQAFLGHPIATLMDKIDFYQRAGYDYVKLTLPFDLKVRPSEATGEASKGSNLDRSAWGTEGAGVITTEDEFEAMNWPEVTDELFREYEMAEKILPDDMQLVGQHGDIFTFTWELMGFQTFSFALVENPQLVERLFQRVGETIYSLFERMARFSRVGALFYSDDIAYQSGLMVSPAVLRKHLFPWMKKIGDLCQARDLPFIYHSDGKLWEVMEDLHDCGVTALQPIEPQAWDIREVKERFGHWFALVGNVDVDLLSRGTPEQVQETASNLIASVGQDGGYCLGSGNTIPAYARPENYLAMLKTAWEKGSLE